MKLPDDFIYVDKDKLNQIYVKHKYTAFIFDRRVMDNIGMFEIINPIPALYLYKDGKICMQVEADKQDLLRIKKQWEDRNI